MKNSTRVALDVRLRVCYKRDGGTRRWEADENRINKRKIGIKTAKTLAYSQLFCYNVGS